MNYDGQQVYNSMPYNINPQLSGNVNLNPQRSTTYSQPRSMPVVVNNGYTVQGNGVIRSVNGIQNVQNTNQQYPTMMKYGNTQIPNTLKSSMQAQVSQRQYQQSQSNGFQSKKPYIQQSMIQQMPVQQNMQYNAQMLQAAQNNALLMQRQKAMSQLLSDQQQQQFMQKGSVMQNQCISQFRVQQQMTYQHSPPPPVVVKEPRIQEMSSADAPFETKKQIIDRRLNENISIPANLAKDIIDFHLLSKEIPKLMKECIHSIGEQVVN